MKKKLLLLITFSLLFLFPKLNFAQAPDFGAASSFAVFSSAGAFANVGPTNVTGDVGNNAGAFAAFPPGILIGNIHNLDATSQQAATDLALANTFMLGIACGPTIAPALGGQIVTPGVYCLAAATTLAGTLTLDAQGNSNAIFIIKINNTLTTTALSNLVLINSASLCNVYWHVTGAVVLGANSTFGGTIVSNAAITLGDGAILSGRALTTAGAISLTNNTITIAAPPTASIISANGPTTFCSGGSVVLLGNINGIWSNSQTTASITVQSSGNYYVTNSNAPCSAESNRINVIVNPLPAATVGSDIAICNGTSVTIGWAGVTGNTYAWLPIAGLNSAAIPNPVASPSVTTSYTLTETITATGCTKTNSITVTVDNTLIASVITASGPTTFCGNEYVDLSGNTGGTWSNTAAVSTPSLSVNTSGNYFVTNTNSCNTVTSNHIIITVNPQPAAATGNDVAYCFGNFASLGATPIAGHIYSWTPAIGLNNVTSAQPYASPLISTIYTLTEIDSLTGCSNTNSVIVKVNPLPSATTIDNTSICFGQSLTIGGNSTTGNVYLWSPTIDLNSATISNPIASPTDTITYALTEIIVATGCSKSNSVKLLVNTYPNIVSQPADQAVLISTSAVFQVKVTGSGNTYTWRKGLVELINGGNIAGADTDSLTIIAVSAADTSSNYNVVISGVCELDTVSENASLRITLLGVFDNQIDKISEIASVFPNPFTNSINVVVNDFLQDNLEIVIFNAVGVKVLSKSLNAELNIVETNQLSKGIYFYHLRSKDKILQSGKIVRD